jgi:hypothetical protein
MLRFIDGFKHYATADISKKWTIASCAGVANTGGPTGGGYAYWNDMVSNELWQIFEEQRTWVFGFRHMWSGYATGGIFVNNDQLHYIGYGGGTQVEVVCDGTGRLGVASGHGTTWTPAPVLAAGTWKYIELKVFISTAAGTIDIRVDGEDVINLTGINTNPVGVIEQTANTVGMGKGRMNTPSGLSGPLYTDLYICDGQGSLNKDFLGDLEVQTLYPMGAGNNSQWTPTAGSNWENVDDPAANGDTDYVHASEDSAIDTYTYTDVTGGVSGIVAGIQHSIFARKASAGTVHVAAVTRPNATDYIGDAETLSISYRNLVSIEETNPETDIPWTISGVNAAQFGQKVVA